MGTTSDLAVAECHNVERARWRRTIDLVIDSFAGRFARVEAPALAAIAVPAIWAADARHDDHGQPDMTHLTVNEIRA